MFAKLDAWIEKKLKKSLHKKRQSIIDKAISAVQEEHQTISPEDLAGLRKKIESEANRVYDFIDRSILRERIKRAKYTFWAVMVSALILVGTIFILTKGTAAVFISPVSTAFVSWLVSILTIPISYNQRAKGAMISTINNYLRELNNPSPSKKVELDEKADSTKAIVLELQQQVKSLSQQVAALTAMQHTASIAPQLIEEKYEEICADLNEFQYEPQPTDTLTSTVDVEESNDRQGLWYV